MVKETQIWLFVLFTLFSYSMEQSKGMHSRVTRSCPFVCICKRHRVECVNKSIKSVPDNLPKSAIFLDISENKNLRIPETFFSEFSHLRYLNVDDCEIEKHFLLPKRLMSIRVRRNRLSLKEFRLMFANFPCYLRILKASANNMEIKTRVPLFRNAASLKNLDLHYNAMPVLYREIFKGLSGLSFLDISVMSIKQIEHDAFKDLVRLTELLISRNKIISLPQRLFKPLRNLLTLDFSNCRLKDFPDLTGLPRSVRSVSFRQNHIKNISKITNMGITSFTFLLLGHNNIRELPARIFQTIAAAEIDLSNNKLQKIESRSFTACQNYSMSIILSSNQLTSISADAFSGLTYLSSLFLFGNNISTIHPNAFKGMIIRDLFLYNNSFSKMPAIWQNMRKPPAKVFLFDNPLTRISNLTVRGMQIYLNCDKLRKIIGPANDYSILNCAPFENFVFQIAYGKEWRAFAAESGYSCRRTHNLVFSCKPCPYGYFLGHDSLCIKCPAGSFYQDQLAQLHCKICPLGQYVPPEKVPGKNALECITCPEGTQTNQSAGFRACKCLNGFSRRYRFGGCVKCETKGIQCERDYQTVRPNFWWSWEYNRTCLTKYLAFMDNIETKNNSYDLESSVFHCTMPKPHKCLTRGICLGGIQAECRKGYTGPLCALCQKGYYKHFNSCAQCPRLWIVSLQLLAYLILFIFVCAVVNWADKLIVSLSHDEGRSLADVILSMLKILLGFYQVLNGTVTSFSHIPWPKTFHKALNIFKYIELELLRLPSLRCVKHSWEINAVSDFWISLLLTVSVPCVIYLYYLVRKCILRKTCLTRHEFLEKVKSCKKACFRSTLIFLFSSYPITSKRILQLLQFACHKICYDSSQKYCASFIRADYSLQCLSSNSEHWLLYVVYVCVSIPVGLPLLLLIHLLCVFRARKDKYLYTEIGFDGCNPDPSSGIEANDIIQTDNSVNTKDTLHFATKFLYENYRPSCWYWEIVEMYRKLILTSVLPIFVSQNKVVLGMAIILSTFFIVLHAYIKPMKDSFESHLQLISLSVIPANLCIGFILETMANESSGAFAKTSEELGTAVLLLILNSLLIIVLLARLVKIQTKKWLILLSEHQCNCRCCLACIIPCVYGRISNSIPI